MRFFVLLFALAAAIASPALPATMCCGGVPAFILDGTPTVTGTKDTPLVPFTMTASYGAPPVTYSLVSGTFPTGVTINASTGVVSGTPTNSGTFANIILGAEDSWSPAPHRTAQFHTFTMVIASPANALTVSATPTTTGTVGSAVTPFTVTASGGTPPYTYALFSRYLPSGVTLHAATGVVDGTPTEDGTYAAIVIRATDSLGAVGNLAGFDWVVNAASPAVALSLTGTTPVNYIFAGALPTGAIRTAHGLTINERASTNPIELDSDGNSIGTEYYGYTQTGSASPDWPPGYPSTPPYTVAPLTVNTNTTYPFRFNLTGAHTTDTVFIRGGRAIGSISSSANQVRLAMYPLETVAGAAPHIVTPQAWPDCYDGAQSSPPIYTTWVNANVTGASGSHTITTIGQVTNSTMFVGEEVSSPAGTSGIPADTHVTVLTSTHTVTIDNALTGAITKATFRGCTETYQNSAAFIIGEQTGTFSVNRVRADHVWDGIRTCAVNHTAATEISGPCTDTVTGVWLSYCRDDCIENDHNWPLTVTDSLVDGGFSGISSDSTQSPSVETTMLITLDSTLLHVNSRPDSINNPVDPFADYGIPFKLGTGAPSLALTKTIIAVDGASALHVSRYISAWANMTNGTGSCSTSGLNSITGLTGDYFLYLGDDTPTTATIGDMATPGSTIRNCFTYQTGATARATWAAAKAAWQVAHPWIYRLSSDP